MLLIMQFPPVPIISSLFRPNVFLTTLLWNLRLCSSLNVRASYTNLLTPKNRVLLGKLTGSQLVKKFPTFYGTESFNTAFMSACHLSLSSARLIQSMPPHPTSWRSILISSSHLCLGIPSGLLPLGFPTKTLYTPLLSTIGATCPAHLILLGFITETMFGEEYTHAKQKA